MDEDEVIEISSGEEAAEDQEDEYREPDRRAILEPVITRVVDALGGYESGVYRLGDEVGGCLKDLKKLWRKDDTDDERTVARIFWETRVLPNDLIPILMATAGAGLVEDKRAIACADLITAMTWPIDMAEELKELDELLDKGSDYTTLLQSHLYYKAALLKPGVLQALFGIMLPPLSKPPKERKERDGQIVNVVLHLIRNLAFIKDLPSNILLSADQAKLSQLQTQLVRGLSETHTFQLLLTIAANTAKDPLLNSWNTLVLEIFYLLYRGVKPTSLAADQAKQPTENLQRLLAAETRSRQDLARKANSRHSRFGTTIAVKLNPNKKNTTTDAIRGASQEPDGQIESRALVLHRQQAIKQETGAMLDIAKRHKARKGHTVDELTRDDNLTMEAKFILQTMATEFVEACFNPFLAAVLKDIRSERAKITQKDNLRLLYVTKWFLEYFLSSRAKEKSASGKEKWGLGLVAEVTERTWIVWVLKRMREAVEEKPKLWTELQAGIECLTQLLLLIDDMSTSEIADPVLHEAADVLQQQLIYNGEVLDIAFESLRSYKEGTQSLAYLDSSVYLSYALMRMLERWGKNKGGDVYVRKKKAKRRGGAKVADGEDVIPDVEDEPEQTEDVVHETMFTFEAFEMKFAHAEITHTLLTYLARYKQFTSSENMRRVVSLMHRQAVRAKAEGLFFKLSTLDLFRTILADQKSFPREQPYKDLVNLINYILRQFFKALADEPFLAIEVLYPKNRGNWKQFSSWQPEEKAKREQKTVEDTRFPQDVEVKKGHSWSDQVGIAIACLVEDNQKSLVEWTKQILAFVVAYRQRIIEQTDGNQEVSSSQDEGDDEPSRKLIAGPSNEAIEKIKDHLIPYETEEHAEAATRNPHLKLLWRLSKFSILEEDGAGIELEWLVPATVTPEELGRTLKVIDQFLETPFDLDGKKASRLLSKRSRRRKRRRSPSPTSDAGSEIDEQRKQRKEKQKKEKQQYKSAQFIEDSDEEYGGIEEFLEKEKELRERIALESAAAGGNRTSTMKPTGTKKKRKRPRTKPKSAADTSDHQTSGDEGVDNPAPSKLLLHQADKGDQTAVEVPPRPRPRPRPRALFPPKPNSPQAHSSPPAETDTGHSEPPDPPLKSSEPAFRKKSRVIISDED